VDASGFLWSAAEFFKSEVCVYSCLKVARMGYVYVDVVVKGKSSKSIKALVDTGSAHIVLTPEIVSELGLHQTPYEVDLTLADRRRVKARLFLAEVEAKGRSGPAFVAEMDVSTPLLGVYALEALGLKPNLTTGELEIIGPEGGYLLTQITR